MTLKQRTELCSEGNNEKERKAGVFRPLRTCTCTTCSRRREQTQIESCRCLSEDCKHAQGKKTTRAGEHVTRATPPARHPLTQPPPMSGTYLLLKPAAPPLRKDAPLPPRLGKDGLWFCSRTAARRRKQKAWRFRSGGDIYRGTHRRRWRRLTRGPFQDRTKPPD